MKNMSYALSNVGPSTCVSTEYRVVKKDKWLSYAKSLNYESPRLLMEKLFPFKYLSLRINTIIFEANEAVGPKQHTAFFVEWYWFLWCYSAGSGNYPLELYLKIEKMAMGSCYTCIRYLMFAFNFLFWVSFQFTYMLKGYVKHLC